MWGGWTPFSVWPLNFSLRAPSHEDRAHQMLNIRCNICFRFLNLYLCWPSGATSHCRQFFCTEVVIWSYTTVPVAFRLPDTVHFYELEGTGMLFASNQMCRLAGHSLASQGTLTTADTSEISQITPLMTLSVAESLACWTQAQKGLGSDRSVTLSGNSLRQTVHTHRALPSSEIGSSPLKVCEGKCGPG